VQPWDTRVISMTARRAADVWFTGKYHADIRKPVSVEC